MSVSRESNWIITLTSGFFQIKIENICLFRPIKKHANVFENWLCPNFLLLPKKSELPKIWGGCSPPHPPRPVRLCLRFLNKCLMFLEELNELFRENWSKFLYLVFFKTVPGCRISRHGVLI